MTNPLHPHSVANLIKDGGTLFRGTYASTAIVRTKIVDNSQLKREKITLYCKSSQDGTWIIYDIDEAGVVSQFISIPVTANTLSVYSYNHIAYRLYTEFTPTSAPGTETLVIRGYAGGFGVTA